MTLFHKKFDTLYVSWTLLNECNYECAFCDNSIKELKNKNSVYSLERLLAMAYRILEIPKNAFSFNFSGGEPTLHPQLLELLTYLFNAGRNVSVTLDTNCSQDLDYYRNLSVSLPAAYLGFNLHVHPMHADPEHILSLVSSLVRSAHNVLVTFHYDGKLKKKSDYLYSNLCSLRQEIPFNLVISIPEQELADKNKIVGAMEAEFTKSANSGPACEPVKQPLTNTETLYGGISKETYHTPIQSKEDFKNFFCCTGSNLLRIEPDGGFYGSCCDVSLRNLPLWHTHSSIRDALQIIQCPREVCTGCLNIVLPKFAKQDEALSFLEECSHREMEIRENSRPPVAPASLNIKPDISWTLSTMLRELKPAGEEKTIEAFPDLAKQRMEDIVKVYEGLADEDSKKIFLAGIKAMATGNAGFLPNSSFTPFRHPKVNEEEDDIIFADATGIGDLFQLSKIVKISDLEEARGKLYQLKPKIQLALALDTDSFLAIPLWMLKHAPGYDFYLGSHSESGGIILYGRHPQSPDRRIRRIFSNEALHFQMEELNESEKSPLFTIIVPVTYSTENLIRTMDSILLQDMDGVEIILLNHGQSSSVTKIIYEYAQRFPKVVRPLRINVSSAAGEALNSAIDRVSGKYVSFLDPDNMLAEDFLAQGLNIIKEQDADIVVFNTVFCMEPRSEIYSPQQSGVFAGLDSLAMLGKRAESFFCLYRSEFLRKHNIRFNADYVPEDLYLPVQAFYWSAKTIFLPHIGAYIYDQSKKIIDNAGYAFKMFAQFCDFLTDFFVSNGLDPESELYAILIRYEYVALRDRIFQEISAAQNNRTLAGLLAKDRLLKIGRARPALELMIKEFAELHCWRTGVSPIVAMEDLDWRKAAAQPKPAKTYSAYGNAETPSNKPPMLSVIVPNYNKAKYLPQCMDSILSQSRKDFEVIIVDDASTDESWDILRQYADTYPRIRLYRMDNNCRQGICRNLGMDKARGKYLTFVDSDDFLEPGFFVHGLKTIEENNADIAFFSLKWRKGSEQHRVQIQEDAVVDSDTLYNMYINVKIDPAPYAKIIRTDVARLSGAKFEEHIYHQDHFFLWHLIKKVRLAVTKKFMAYQVNLSENSSIRPFSRKYLHSSSVCKFYKLLNIISEDRKENLNGMLRHMDWNLKDVFLYTQKAFLDECGELALTPDDYAALAKNSLFLRALLEAYALCREKGNIPAGILMQKRSTWEKYLYTKLKEPLISVIVPTYNQEGPIVRCLDSILSQNLRSLEIIIVNDASTDHTLEVCNAYAAQDGRIRVISNEINRSQGYSRNRAMKIAKGKYIVFVDSDDYILEFLQHGLADINQHKEVDFIQYSSSLKDPLDNKDEVWKEFQQRTFMTGKNFFNLYIKGGRSWWNALAKIFSKDFLLKNDILFPEHFFEDAVFIYKAYGKARYVLIDPQIVYMQIRTLHEASTMKPTKWTYRHMHGYLSYTGWLSNNLSQYDIIDDKNNTIYYRVKYAYGYNLFLSYLASFKNSIINPFQESDKKLINSTPELCRIVLEDYAKLYGSKNNHYINLSYDDSINANILPDHLLAIKTINNNDIAISIIITTYNTENYLTQCLNSVLHQNIKNMEIILIDDCSTKDRTFDICKEYAETNDNIRLFQTPWHSGASVARNLGMDVAKGKYYTFLDPYVYFTHGFLRKALERLNNNPCDIATFNIKIEEDKDIKSTWIHKPDMQIDPYISSLDHMQGKYKHWDVCGRIFNRSFIENNNIKFMHYYNEKSIFILQAYALCKNHWYMDINSVIYEHNKSDDINEYKTCSKYIFDSIIYSISNILSIFEHYNDHQKQVLNKNLMDSNLFMGQKLWGYFLGYIHACVREKLPYPLTKEVINKLQESGEFMPYIFRKYAEMYVENQENNILKNKK